MIVLVVLTEHTHQSELPIFYIVVYVEWESRVNLMTILVTYIIMVHIAPCLQELLPVVHENVPFAVGVRVPKSCNFDRHVVLKVVHNIESQNIFLKFDISLYSHMTSLSYCPLLMKNDNFCDVPSLSNLITMLST